MGGYRLLSERTLPFPQIVLDCFPGGSVVQLPFSIAATEEADGGLPDTLLPNPLFTPARLHQAAAKGLSQYEGSTSYASLSKEKASGPS